MSWPDRDAWRAWLRFVALFCLAFFPVYAGAAWLALAAQPGHALYFAFERDIPLIPWMIWPYLSLFSLYLLPLFLLTPTQTVILTCQSLLCVVVAGVVFVVLPVRTGFAPVQVEGLHAPVFVLLRLVDVPPNTNLAPSLHVAGAALLLLACASRAPRWLALACLVWLPVISASTVLVHQHHILDVASGFALALLARRVFPLPPQVTPPAATA